MPRALWSGAISFGLVNVPVRMYAAISEHNVHFNMLRGKDAERIHYRKVAGSSGREVPDDQIVKGYEVSDGEYVTLTDEEIAAAHVEGDKVIEIHEFVPLEEIDPIVFERTYYLAPAEGAERVYALFAEALESSGLVGIASFVFHDRDQLAAVRAKDGVLLLERMYFADEIRDRDGILPDRKRAVDKRELELATDLIERMQGSFDHSAYHDRYRERLMSIIEKKRKGETITAPKAEERKAPSDLMAALEASLSEAVGRSKTGKEPAAARRRPEKKATRTKSPKQAKSRKTPRKKAAKTADS
jgi:DNA end-binding protein Ku